MRARKQPTPDARCVVDGITYAITSVIDVTGRKWWVNAWDDSTAYHAMGASQTRLIKPSMAIVRWPPSPSLIKLAMHEARQSLERFPPLPSCVAGMGCACAAHARDPKAEHCNANE